jgi:hypothetical protein
MLFLFYFVPMKKKIYLVAVVTLLFYGRIIAQSDDVPYTKDAIKENRAQQYRNLVNNIINKNLALPLSGSTEENWQDAFYALELINYRSAWIDERIRLAFDSVEKRSTGFQRALLELAYSNYTGKFVAAADILMRITKDPKIFAIAAEYYIAAGKDPNAWDKVVVNFSKRPDKDDNIPVYYGLLTGLITEYSAKKDLSVLLSNLKTLIPGQILLISFQRKNRNYPGIAVVRDASGNFIKDRTGNIFSVSQLARSINNLPFYLTNGNTPQGIFRMNGFDVSKSMAIGPTSNIQLIMPYETSPRHFLNDHSIADTAWTEELYKKLIPENLKEYLPLYESFFASKAGRTEIIAHGTTVNPEYYKDQPYYPLTPTEGCLCAKEIWSTIDGKRVESDQQKLVNALKAAGGASGYCIVIEIDDQQRPVSINDLLPYLK